MSLSDNCLKYFATSNLYEVLGVSQNVSQAQLKKAFYKISLICHPDRVPDQNKEEATRKFQIVSKVYCILSDEEQRALYDETGCIDEENAGFEDKNWDTYWRLIFPKVTKADYFNFMEKYKGSEEEIEDLKRCYIKAEGDMNIICETFIGYMVEEEEKYAKILKELIEKKEIPAFPKFTKETKAKKNARVKRFKKEASEAAKITDEIDDSLTIAIMQRSASRRNQFDDMVKNLEAKYGKSAKKQKKK